MEAVIIGVTARLSQLRTDLLASGFVDIIWTLSAKPARMFTGTQGPEMRSKRYSKMANRFPCSFIVLLGPAVLEIFHTH